MKVLDLFSGIGGFSLGLERAGMETAMFCEIEPFCRRVLAKHWPGVPIHDDVRTMGAKLLAEHGVAVDLVCGGFPCQDISVAGKGAGLGGGRSGLWFEYLRVIEETRPRWVVIENVPALRSRGLDTVLGGIAALGYDAEWHCIPAASVGAPHRRDRIWLVAYARSEGRRQELRGAYGHESSDGAQHVLLAGSHGAIHDVADPDSHSGPPGALHAGQGPRGRDAGGSSVSDDVADTRVTRLPAPERQALLGSGWWEERRAASECGWWRSEPDVGRVAYGVPSRVDRLRALGNAVVPQVVEVIGRAIMAAEAAR